MTVNILAVGDVCGKTGLETLARRLPAVKKTYDVSFTVVNGENANVVGVTPAQAEAIFAAAVALKVDPNAPAQEDPYSDPQYQVPDDLVW